jgi:hypothetical protein
MLGPATYLDAWSTTIGATAAAVASTGVHAMYRRVWVGAPMNADGSPKNTDVLLIGNETTQNRPLFPTDHNGFFVEVDSPKKLYAKTLQGGSGQTIAVQAERLVD